MLRNWQVEKPNPPLQRKLSNELSISPMLSQLLINRGITDADSAASFLEPQLNHLLDPFELKGMDEALARLKEAVEDKERILIFGDYDVDGLTATALLVKGLKKLGGDVHSYIPDRLKEGYGLNDNALDAAQSAGAGLLISADCGTNAHGVISRLKESGVDTIVIDHHELTNDDLPGGILINPLQRDCSYPYKHLSGAGVSYKFLQALEREFSLDARDDLDLAALGTVCDVVPMIGENRIIAKHGISRLKETKKTGLSALMEVARVSSSRLSSYHLGFILGPRLNAQGRLHSAEKSLKLLLTESASEAKELAASLHADNAQRQRIEAEILRQARARIECETDFARDKVIVLADQRWHPGVIGIVASKLVDEFYRPTILIAAARERCRGSGRSIAGFDMIEALDHCSRHLLGYGGHKAACGLTIEPQEIENFKRTVNDFAKGRLIPSELVPAIDIDMEIFASELSVDAVRQIERLSPFGAGNRKPLFLSRNLKLKSEPKYVGRKTVKFWLTDGKTTFEAISFDAALLRGLAAERFDAVYTPAIDDWHGETFIQLEIKDLRESGG